jgi:hypothetical protein
MSALLVLYAASPSINRMHLQRTAPRNLVDEPTGRQALESADLDKPRRLRLVDDLLEVGLILRKPIDGEDHFLTGRIPDDPLGWRKEREFNGASDWRHELL